MEDDPLELENLISDAIGVEVFSYNGEVTNEFVSVMRLVSQKKFNTDIAKELSLKPSHVELIQYLLCNNNHAEYGTSPRGCWLTAKGKELWARIETIERKELV